MDGAQTSTEELQDRIERARSNHYRAIAVWPERDKYVYVCGRCVYGDGVHFVWPCPTAAALDGTEAGTWAHPTEVRYVRSVETGAPL